MEIKKIENVIFFAAVCSFTLRFQHWTRTLEISDRNPETSGQTQRIGNPAAAVILDFQKFKILTFGPL